MGRRTFRNSRSNFRRGGLGTAPKLSTKAVVDLKGLNTEAPDEIMKDGFSPLLKNARYYAEGDEEKRVSISSSLGSGFYTLPVDGYSQTTNLVENPSFETGVSGWTGTDIQKVSGAQSGDFSMRVTNNAGSNAEYTTTDIVEQSTDYVLSLYLKGNGATNVIIDIDHNGSTIATDSLTPPASFTRYEITGTTAAADDEITIRVAPVGTSSTVDVDAVLLETGTVASDYFDGSTDDSGLVTYEWRGTAHGSISDAYTTTGEEEETSQISTTGADDETIGLTSWLADEFTPSATGLLTKVEVNIKDTAGLDGRGPIILRIHSDDSGEPGDEIARTSILHSDVPESYEYVSARFVQLPKLTASTKYWLVAYIQDNGVDNYEWSSTTSSNTALTSSDSGANWSSTSFALNFKTYTVGELAVKGVYRRKDGAGTKETLVAIGDHVFTTNDATGEMRTIIRDADSQATDYYFEQIQNDTYIVNGFDTLKKYNGSTVSEVSNAPIGRLVIEHKNFLFVARNDDLSRIDFSDLADYETWPSTNFINVPAPNTGDPIVGWIGFQDSLTIFTRNSKYILYGDDPATFSLREAVGSRGAVNQDCIVTDNNFIYFLSDDGVYRFNGSTDELISSPVSSVIDAMANKAKASGIFHDRKYKLYYPTGGFGQNNATLVWDIVYEDWFRDTNTHYTKAVVTSQEKDHKIIQASSRGGMLFFGEVNNHHLGYPIEFAYWTKYFNLGSLEEDSLLKRLYVMLRAQEQPFNLIVGVDRNYEESPTTTLVPMQRSGDLWDSGEIWDDTFEYGSNPFLRKRIFANRQGANFQVRFSRTGVDNPVDILSYTFYYKRIGAK